MNDTQIAEMVTLVEEAEADLQAANEVEALKRLDAAMPTIRQTFDQAVAQPGPTLALRLAGGLWRYWHIRGTQWDTGKALDQDALLAMVVEA
jgi:hypothetical protein